MYALQMQTACQGDGTGEPDDPSSLHQEPVRPATQDCSSFDIVRATQVMLVIELKNLFIFSIYTLKDYTLYLENLQ